MKNLTVGLILLAMVSGFLFFFLRHTPDPKLPPRAKDCVDSDFNLIRHDQLTKTKEGKLYRCIDGKFVRMTNSETINGETLVYPCEPEHKCE